MQPNNMFQPSAPQGPQNSQPPGNSPVSQQPQSASQIKAHRPIVLIVAVVILSLLLLGSLAYTYTLMTSRNDFRDNAQQKIEEANEIAVAQSREEQEIEFIEREKRPLVNYTGPSEFGTVSIDYPKIWSAYVDESKKGSTPIDGYFHPGFVPGVDSGISFALRLEVLESSYDKELKGFASAAEKGEVKVRPITLEKVPNVAGSRIDGEVERDKQGSVVLFPLRDKTIKVSVLTDTFLSDFNDKILKNMSFVP